MQKQNRAPHERTVGYNTTLLCRNSTDAVGGVTGRPYQQSKNTHVEHGMHRRCENILLRLCADQTQFCALRARNTTLLC